ILQQAIDRHGRLPKSLTLQGGSPAAFPIMCRRRPRPAHTGARYRRMITKTATGEPKPASPRFRYVLAHVGNRTDGRVHADLHPPFVGGFQDFKPNAGAAGRALAAARPVGRSMSNARA